MALLKNTKLALIKKISVWHRAVLKSVYCYLNTCFWQLIAKEEIQKNTAVKKMKMKIAENLSRRRPSILTVVSSTTDLFSCIVIFKMLSKTTRCV